MMSADGNALKDSSPFGSGLPSEGGREEREGGREGGKKEEGQTEEIPRWSALCTGDVTALLCPRLLDGRQSTREVRLDFQSNQPVLLVHPCGFACSELFVLDLSPTTAADSLRLRESTSNSSNSASSHEARSSPRYSRSQRNRNGNRNRTRNSKLETRNSTLTSKASPRFVQPLLPILSTQSTSTSTEVAAPNSLLRTPQPLNFQPALHARTHARMA